MMAERLWTRQWAQQGNLVKEKRFYLLRRPPPEDGEGERDRTFLARQTRFYRDQKDQLEMRLACFGLDGEHWRLSFNDLTLPENYYGVVAAFDRFIRRCKYDREKRGLDRNFPYVKRIEGLHGDKRYHIHFVCSGKDFDRDRLARLWGCGDVEFRELLLDFRGYARMRDYLLKERLDGLRFPLDKEPLSWSRSVRLPEVHTERVASGRIYVPRNAVTVSTASCGNEWGAFQYASYMIPDRTRAGARAWARARTILQWASY